MLASLDTVYSLGPHVGLHILLIVGENKNFLPLPQTKGNSHAEPVNEMLPVPIKTIMVYAFVLCHGGKAPAP